MVQAPSIPRSFSTDVDHHVVAFPTRPGVRVPNRVSAQSGSRAAANRQVGVRTQVTRGVALVEVAGRLDDVVEDLDRAIQLALAEGPRGVVCDLSGVPEGAQPAAVKVLAAAGRHVRDWSGIPVAVASPHSRLRESLAAHPLGGHLIVTDSLFSAVSVVLATPAVAVARLRLAPHPTAPRAARDFVARTLPDWGLGKLILAADFVVSELVSGSIMQATADIELCIAWTQGALRLTVRDDSPHLPRQRYSQFDLYGFRLTAAAGISRAFGVLPTGDGGKVTWAVLNAARPRQPISAPRLGHAKTPLEPPILGDAPSLDRWPLFAVSGQLPNLTAQT